MKNFDEELEREQIRNIRMFKAITVLVIILVAIIAAFVVLSGKNNELKKVNRHKNVKQEDVSSEKPTEDPHKGQARSMFTGLWIDEDIVNKRPYAFMFNNIKNAFPQSGTSEMDIIYEAVVEGGITR